jgi:hypothetical protein
MWTSTPTVQPHPKRYCLVADPNQREPTRICTRILFLWWCVGWLVGWWGCWFWGGNGECVLGGGRGAVRLCSQAILPCPPLTCPVEQSEPDGVHTDTPNQGSKEGRKEKHPSPSIPSFKAEQRTPHPGYPFDLLLPPFCPSFLPFVVSFSPSSFPPLWSVRLTCPVEQSPMEYFHEPTRVLRGISGVDRPMQREATADSSAMMLICVWVGGLGVDCV